MLSPDGQFSSFVIQNSCGDRGLDDVAVQAFRQAAPFPNPPRGMIGSDGLIHIYAGLTVFFKPPSFGPAG
jgi:TonB family protein